MKATRRLLWFIVLVLLSIQVGDALLAPHTTLMTQVKAYIGMQIFMHDYKKWAGGEQIDRLKGHCHSVDSEEHLGIYYNCWVYQTEVGEGTNVKTVTTLSVTAYNDKVIAKLADQQLVVSEIDEFSSGKQEFEQRIFSADAYLDSLMWGQTRLMEFNGPISSAKFSVCCDN